MVDLVSLSLVQSLGMTPCDKEKHQHEEPLVEGIGRKKAKTYGFYHLKLCMMDRRSRPVQCIRPFLAVDRGPRDSQVLLGRPALKDLKVSIDNSSDSWEIKNSPRIKKVSSTQFDRDILSGAQVFEVRAIYKPISTDPEEGRKLLAPKGLHKDKNDSEGPIMGHYCKKNKNKSSGERRREKNALRVLWLKMGNYLPVQHPTGRVLGYRAMCRVLKRSAELSKAVKFDNCPFHYAAPAKLNPGPSAQPEE